LRYAKSITFKVGLQDNKEQKIYVPFIEIEYGAIKQTDTNALNNFVSISLSVNSIKKKKKKTFLFIFFRHIMSL
jgi:hypothetical protein